MPQITVNVPVISVGNITAGGTGKTPFTIALAQFLVSQGAKVLVLSRGYRSKKVYVPGEPLVADHGDEPYCIQLAVPTCTVWVGKNRARLAQQAIETLGVTIILLDDGHQHHALHKTMNVVLLDAERGLGNGYCLPLGPCREPWRPTLNTLYVWMHKTSSSTENGIMLHGLDEQNTIHCEVKTIWYQAGNILPDKWAIEQPVIVVAGIANPQPLILHLQSKGAKEIKIIPQPDHATYTALDWEHWQQQASNRNALLVTTQKDWVKAPQQEGFWKNPPVVADLQVVLPDYFKQHIRTLIKAIINKD